MGRPVNTKDLKNGIIPLEILRVDIEEYVDLMQIHNKKGMFMAVFSTSHGPNSREPKAILWMDPVSAKGIAGALSINIKSYEEKYGEISMPGREQAKEKDGGMFV